MCAVCDRTPRQADQSGFRILFRALLCCALSCYIASLTVKEKMDFYVGKKLEEWNLSSLKEIFEGKVASFHNFFMGFTSMFVFFCMVNWVSLFGCPLTCILTSCFSLDFSFQFSCKNHQNISCVHVLCTKRDFLAENNRQLFNYLVLRLRNSPKVLLSPLAYGTKSYQALYE